MPAMQMQLNPDVSIKPILVAPAGLALVCVQLDWREWARAYDVHAVG